MLFVNVFQHPDDSPIAVHDSEGNPLAVGPQPGQGVETIDVPTDHLGNFQAMCPLPDTDDAWNTIYFTHPVHGHTSLDVYSPSEDLLFIRVGSVILSVSSIPRPIGKAPEGGIPA
jgi:hypothetical protein